VAGPELPGRFRWLAPITIGLLFVLTVGAFGLSQRLKREPLVIDRVVYRATGARENDPKRTVFTPNGDCRRDSMLIGFRTTRSDLADVDIIGRGETLIRRLATDRFFKRYREHQLTWDGRKDNGNVPQTGAFRVRVTMKGLDRILYLPGKIRLHRFPRTDSACGGERSGGPGVEEADAGRAAESDPTGPSSGSGDQSGDSG
jgi:hypothetical protein